LNTLEIVSMSGKIMQLQQHTTLWRPMLKGTPQWI